MNEKLSLKFISNIKSISWAKLILPLFVIIFVLLSIVGMKNKIEYMNQMQRGVEFSRYEQEQYYCAQSTAWFPIGIGIGLLFVLLPLSLDRFLFFRLRKNGLMVFIYRMFGAAIVLLTTFDLWANCKSFIALFP